MILADLDSKLGLLGLALSQAPREQLEYLAKEAAVRASALADEDPLWSAIWGTLGTISAQALLERRT